MLLNQSNESFLSNFEIKKQEAIFNGNSIDVNHLSPGFYFIQINTSQDNYVMKFLKE